MAAQSLDEIPRQVNHHHQKASPVATGAGSVLAGWLLGAAFRRFGVRTGVSDAEAFASLPGDEFLPHPMLEWTRGITVHAMPDNVWPWVVQMGYGRGGWYTPQWVDRFVNRWVFGVRHRIPTSADRLLPATSTSPSGI